LLFVLERKQVTKYTVKVEQTLEHVMEVDATSEEEAVDHVEELLLNWNLPMQETSYQIIVED
jgi:hypothetical protein